MSERKGQQAYIELRRRILVLEFEPGQLLNESELVESLGCGRTPIREAIQRLAAEKLVVARLRQTPFVAPILAHELAEIVETRLILEVPAARLAAERGSAKQRIALNAACAVFHDYARADDREGILATDVAIHSLVSAMSRNSFLVDSSERLASFSQRISWLSVRNVRQDEAFIHCHDELTRAICTGDTDAAERAASEHVALFEDRLRDLLRPVPPRLRDVPRMPMPGSERLSRV